VFVDLVVRGICCLRPGVPGVSDNIRVRSIVGRFLEHSRVFYFHSSGEEKVFCASADWMDRNFFRRVEVAYPIEDPDIKARLLADLELFLNDNQQAWELRADGSYEKITPTADAEPICAQSTLLAMFADSPLPL
jgi:polyphosphate kinase